MATVRDLVCAPGVLRAKDQVIDWDPGRWEDRLGLSWSPALRELRAACASDGVGLRRSVVASFGRADPARLLEPVMHIEQRG